jgi:hypothetical protein
MVNKINWTEEEKSTIAIHGETCLAVAEKAMVRSCLNFDDIERINNHYENHIWGSNTDRQYRKTAIRKAVAKVAANPLNY